MSSNKVNNDFLLLYDLLRKSKACFRSCKGATSVVSSCLNFMKNIFFGRDLAWLFWLLDFCTKDHSAFEFGQIRNILRFVLVTWLSKVLVMNRNSMPMDKVYKTSLLCSSEVNQHWVKADCLESCARAFSGLLPGGSMLCR